MHFCVFGPDVIVFLCKYLTEVKIFGVKVLFTGQWWTVMHTQKDSRLMIYLTREETAAERRCLPLLGGFFLAAVGHHLSHVPPWFSSCSVSHDCLTSVRGTTAWHRFINHSSSLMCYFLWARKASWVGLLSAFTTNSSFCPDGIWLLAWVY